MKIRLYVALALISAPTLAIAAPGQTIVGPVSLPSDPKCKTFMVKNVDGTQKQFWARGRKFVKAGGTCPADYITGRKVSATQVDVTDVDGRIFRCDIEYNTCQPR